MSGSSRHNSGYGHRTRKVVSMNHRIGKFGGMNHYAAKALGLPYPYGKDTVGVFEGEYKKKYPDGTNQGEWTEKHETIEADKLSKLDREPTLEDYKQAHAETLVEMGDAKNMEEALRDSEKMAKWANQEDNGINEKVADFAKKLNLKNPVGLKVDNNQNRLGRVRATKDQTTVEINMKQLEKLKALDPELTEKYLTYMLGHELAHVKQLEEYGLTGATALPRWLIEEKADKEAIRITGLSDSDINQVIAQLTAKLKNSVMS
jgi:hypothetical protein